MQEAKPYIAVMSGLITAVGGLVLVDVLIALGVI